MEYKSKNQGNYYDKYNTNNPIAKAMVNRFFKSLEGCLADISFENVLEAGCGEGEIISFVNKKYPEVNHFEGFDIGDLVIEEARLRRPDIRFSSKSIYKTEYSNDAFELTICCEVLEHLNDPIAALEELIRITSKYVILSVPNEPIWRILNLCRGKYIKNLGNTPGHINHYSKTKFLKLIKNYGQIMKIESPFPWTMVLIKK